MKLFMVTYAGYELGGRAIVFAESPEDAMSHVCQHPDTENFDRITVVEIEQSGVIYNNNGSY